MNEQIRDRMLQSTVIRTGVVTVVVLALIWFGLGRSAAEKVVTALAMPYGILWYLLTFLMILCVRTGRRLLTSTAAVVWLGYTLCGNGIVASLIAGNLESEFRTINPLEADAFDVVVVLGGGSSPAVNQRIQGNSSGDRLIVTAQLYHGGLAKRIICTGRNIATLTPGVPDPSEQSRDVLTRLGVPADCIELLGGRTTSEEMHELGRRFSSGSIRVGLVTSAWHLKRAMRLADRNGFHPHPLPADFLAGKSPFGVSRAEFLLSMIPQADAAHTIWKCTKEHLGMLIGR
ncbi:MAG: YdcF family protein [Planctomycetaceae bacterium]|nr:YdcF family protein [Planctomycetaceae bacterium]